MKLNTIALTILLMTVGGGASANPTLQHCSPLEVAHNGSAGLSYTLACAAGDWTLQYSGSVPAGTEALSAQYRLRASHADGSRFTQTRQVRLPSPAFLGQALIREAVVLANGDLALRDCLDFGCTLYRPMGGAEKVTKASVTVTPELKRLNDEAARLSGELAQKQQSLAAQAERVKTLEAQVASLSGQLTGAQAVVAGASDVRQQELNSMQAQFATDVGGLMASAKSALSDAVREHQVRAEARETALTERLAQVTADLKKATEGHSVGQADVAAAQAAHVAAEALVAQRTADVQRIQGELATTQELLHRMTELYDVKLAQFIARPAKAAIPGSGAELVTSAKRVISLTTKVHTLEQHLALGRTAVDAARRDQASKSASLTASTAGLAKEQSSLEAALSQAHATISKLTAEQAARSQANDKLAGDLAASQAEVANLATKVSALSAAGTAEENAALRSELAKVGGTRDAAMAQVTVLTAQLNLASTEYERMAAQRMDAYKGAQQVAQDMLEMLDQFQALELAKREADAALTSSTHKVMELGAKLEAAQLARELAMQTASVAHADADTQHMKNQEVSARLAQTEGQLAAAAAQLESTVAKLRAVQAELAQAQSVHGTQVTDAQELEAQLRQVTQERDQLRDAGHARSARIQQLEALTAQQASEIELLRKALSDIKKGSHPQEGEPAPAHSEEH